MSLSPARRANSAPPTRQLDLVGHFKAGERERKREGREEKKERNEWDEKHPRNKFN